MEHSHLDSNLINQKHMKWPGVNTILKSKEKNTLNSFNAFQIKRSCHGYMSDSRKMKDLLFSPQQLSTLQLSCHTHVL